MPKFYGHMDSTPLCEFLLCISVSQKYLLETFGEDYRHFGDDGFNKFIH